MFMTTAAGGAVTLVGDFMAHGHPPTLRDRLEILGTTGAILSRGRPLSLIRGGQRRRRCRDRSRRGLRRIVSRRADALSRSARRRRRVRNIAGRQPGNAAHRRAGVSGGASARPDPEGKLRPRPKGLSRSQNRGRKRRLVRRVGEVLRLETQAVSRPIDMSRLPVIVPSSALAVLNCRPGSVVVTVTCGRSGLEHARGPLKVAASRFSTKLWS